MIPSLVPLFDARTGELLDGQSVPASDFCKKAIGQRPECQAHYRGLQQKPEGYYQCPFGFTSRSFFLDGQLWIATGVVAFPRFDSKQEREMAKRYPTTKCSRESVEAGVRYLRDVEQYRADAIREAGKVLPQAFHELRKLNAAVLQHAEREISDRGETRGLASIKSAAELMRNNFDILEALSNIEGMRALPSDSTINLFDLAFKLKRVMQERAASRNMGISVNGIRAIIRGSQKSFPIVPAVLLENAIKYGIPGTVIHADVSVEGDTALLEVTNESIGYIDPTRCFDRGTRFSSGVEGGGFGLFLAREIVQCHQGTIHCAAANQTVRMVVELPLVTVIR
jgi:signal transduction histidine kinase